MTPPEINRRGPRALEAQKRALTEGRPPVRKIPEMSIGQGRSGKRRLKKSLQKNKAKEVALQFERLLLSQS